MFGKKNLLGKRNGSEKGEEGLLYNAQRERGKRLKHKKS